MYYNEIAKPFAFTGLALAVLFAPNDPKSFLSCKPRSLNKCHFASESFRVNISESRLITLWGSQPLLGQVSSQPEQSSPHLDHQALEVDLWNLLGFALQFVVLMLYIIKWIYFKTVCLNLFIYIYTFFPTLICFQRINGTQCPSKSKNIPEPESSHEKLFSSSKYINRESLQRDISTQT